MKKQVLSILVIIAIAIGSTIWIQGKSKEVRKYKSALYEKTIKYEDQLGRKVTEVTQLEVTTNELKQIAKKDSASLSDYEKKLKAIYNELAANKRKLRNTEAALLFSEKTEESFGVYLEEIQDLTIGYIDSVRVKSRKVGYYSTDWTEQQFIYDPNTDSLFVSQVGENEFFIDLFRQKELNSKGKKAFWPIRWLKSWEYKASIKSLRDSTTIKDAVVVNMSKR